jgi:pimeloyl-ACP methyl ester carboxylesterase
LVLLQGLGSDSDSAFCTWFDVVAVMRGARIYDDIIDFSYRGPGQPYTRTDTYQTIQQTVDALRATIDNYVSTPDYGNARFDLLGHSLGGVVAWEYAKAYGLDLARPGQLAHVASMDSPVNGSYWLDLLNTGGSAPINEQTRMETIWGSFHSTVAQELGTWHRDQATRTRDNIWWAAALAQHGIRVSTFSSDSDFAIPLPDALIPGFKWHAELGQKSLFSNCGTVPWPILDAGNLLGHNQILHRGESLNALRNFLMEDLISPPEPTPPPVNDNARFIRDITIPDGTVVSPGQALVKTWRMRNTGRSTWGSGYQLAFVGGEQMGAPSAVNVPTTAPGQQVDISVNLTAPASGGNHVGYWQLRNPQGTYFGPKLWVKVNVQLPSSYSIALTADPPAMYASTPAWTTSPTSGLCG